MWVGKAVDRANTDTDSTSPALTGPTPHFMAPCQLRDLTFVALGATFAPKVIAAHLPPNLSACEGGSGGFLVALVREGYRIAPFTTGHVWFDVQDHDGSDGPCRFLAGPFHPTGSAARPSGILLGLAGTGIREGAEEVTATLQIAKTPAFRITLRPTRNWTANAGIDHSISSGGPGQTATRLNVTPWAGDWCDATPVAVEMLADDWADLAPRSLTWAAMGKQAAMTLGLSMRLPG